MTGPRRSVAGAARLAREPGTGSSRVVSAGAVPMGRRPAAGGLRAGRAGAPFLRFVARRLGSLVLVAWAVEIATFLMVRVMPGDPARQVLGSHASATAVAGLRHQLGLDRSFLDQYVHYTRQALRLDFGESFYSHLPVTSELRTRLGPELELIGIAVLIVLVVGIGAGITAGGVQREGASSAGRACLRVHHRRPRVRYPATWSPRCLRCCSP